MQTARYSRDELALRQAVKEVLLLSIIFLIALALFFGTIYFIASIEADSELQNRPWALLLGWLTTIAIGLILGKVRQKEEGVELPKSLVVVRESFQAIMLLLFCGILAYGSYVLYTFRALVVQRPWSLMIGWFAFLMLIAFFAKTNDVIRCAQRE